MQLQLGKYHRSTFRTIIRQALVDPTQIVSTIRTYYQLELNTFKTLLKAGGPWHNYLRSSTTFDILTTCKHFSQMSIRLYPISMRPLAFSLHLLSHRHGGLYEC